MKNVILATLGMGLLAMGLNTASADDVGLGGENAGTCTMPLNPTGIAIDAGTGLVINGANTGLDVNIVNNTVDAASEATLTYTGAVCNAPADLDLTTQNGGITTAAVAPAGFSNRIDYSATATFGACVTTALVTNGTAGAVSGGGVCVGAIADDLTVKIDGVGAAFPLIAGTYADVLTVTLTP